MFPFGIDFNAIYFWPFGYPVATSWLKFEHFQNFSQQHPSYQVAKHTQHVATMVLYVALKY